MRRLRTVVLLAALLLVPGCAAGATPARPAPAPTETAAATGAAMSGLDVVFLTTMASHTEPTLEMVRLSRDRVTDRKLRTLVAAIEATESDELATMRGWLRDAGPPRTARSTASCSTCSATTRTRRPTWPGRTWRSAPIRAYATSPDVSSGRVRPRSR